MSYKGVYDYCQTLDAPVGRNLIRDKVIELTDIVRLRQIRTTLDTTVCRGFYLSAQNTSHRFVQQCGSTVVVVARGMAREWERFVYIKEIMHAFDNPEEATDTGESFEQLLGELLSPSPGRDGWSPQMASELSCFWMALGAMCPEETRISYQNDLNQGRIDEYEIALRIRMPEQYVPQLFHPKFPNYMAWLTAR